MSETITLLIPVLNEIDGLRQIMPRIQKKLFDQILIVDGQSTDGSAVYAREEGYEVYIQKKPGIRHAYIEAFPHVRGDLVITFSPDGNSIPELLPALIAKIKEGYDMVIVSRYFDGAKSEDDNWMTAFGNWMFTRIINILHGGNYTDAMVMYRAYRKKIFYDLQLDNENAYLPERLLCTVISMEPLLSVRVAKRKLSFCDMAGDEPPRIGGSRKLLPFRWGISYLLQVFREVYYWR
ncbi:MAG: glycosyltransferase family 2 protein [Deltaproteobacteria bacterium]|nr:glycosyltransferase family 2 protein [Deltaproteobacteria bacterium]